MTQTTPSTDPGLEEAVRSALATSAGCEPSEVADSLIHATVYGRGQRGEVEAASRKLAEGSSPLLDLVLFDTDRIGQWVFDSSRPPVLEGASAILDALHQDVASKYGEAAVFAGGGEGLLVLPRGHGDAVATAIENRWATETRGALSVTTVVLAASPPDFVSAGPSEEEPHDGARLVTGTAALLARLRDEARRIKDGRLPPRQAVAGHRDRCPSCRDRAGSIDIGRFREAVGYLCEPCDRRWEVGKDRIAGRSFDDLVDGFVDLANLGEEARRLRYLGFLYVDGNALGRVFGRLGSLAELRSASRAVSGVFGRLRSRARRHVADLLGRPDGPSTPFLSLLAGGDEMILILPAALAIDLALRLPAWAETEAGEETGLSELLARRGLARLSLGMGLVAAPLGYPVRYQYALARQLQTNAKSLFYANGGTEPLSCLDFEVVTEGNPMAEELTSARRATYGTEEDGFLQTCRPYRIEELADLVTAVRQARQAGVGTSQLYSLQAGASEGQRVFLNFLLYQLVRRPARSAYDPWLQGLGVSVQERAQVESFFVRPSAALGPQVGVRGTWVTDALELAPFLDLVDKLRGESADAAA